MQPVFSGGCEAFQVAIPHPGCNLPYRLRRCPMVSAVFWLLGSSPRSYWSGGCFFRDKVDQSSPEYLGKILMLYDMHIIYLHQKCTIYQKSYLYIYIDTYYIFTNRHAQTLCFLWCSYPILFPSTKLWILVRNIWRSFSARILQSGNPDKADELIPKPSCNSNTYSMLQATIVWYVLLISCSNHIYIFIFTVSYISYIFDYHIYIPFFSLQSMSIVFFWRRFSDRRSWGLSSVGGAGQIRPALVSRTRLFGWKTHLPDKLARNGFVD